jgi:hypothetical protein
MAINLGVITINGVLAISCDTDPSISGGLVAPVGSFASAKDGSGFYYKSTVSNIGWSLASGATSVNGTVVLDFGSEQDRATSTITVGINPLAASVTNANIKNISIINTETIETSLDDFGLNGVTVGVQNIIDNTSFDIVGSALNNASGNYTVNYLITI